MQMAKREGEIANPEQILAYALFAVGSLTLVLLVFLLKLNFNFSAVAEEYTTPLIHIIFFIFIKKILISRKRKLKIINIFLIFSRIYFLFLFLLHGVLLVNVQLSVVALLLQRPWADASLKAIDNVLIGNFWYTQAHFIDNRPWLFMLLHHAYNVIFFVAIVQLFLLVVINQRASYQKCCIWILASYIVALLAAIYPAVPIPVAPNDFQHNILFLKSSRWTQNIINIYQHPYMMLPYERTSAIIEFPSFHTVMPVIVMYMARYFAPWLRYSTWLVSMLTIISVPTMGVHYIVSCIAGIAIAIASIMIVHYATKGLLALSKRLQFT